MRTAGPRGRRGGGVEELDASPVVALLLFEAADCLMALPASEVARLLTPESRTLAGNVGTSEAWIDLEEYFTGRRSEGPWLRWSRGQRTAWLRVARVVEVLPCPIRALVPMPAWLGAERGAEPPRAGTFWAAGVRGDEVFLLMDPARLADPRES